MFPGVYFERDDYDFMVDVTDWFEQRVQAEAVYVSQGHTLEWSRVRMQNSLGPPGWQGGTRYAESFVRERPELHPRISLSEFALRAGFRVRRRSVRAHGRRLRLGHAPMSNNGAAFSLRYGLTLGITAMEGRGFSNPVDLAVSSDDRVYVLSRTNPLQPEGIRVGVLDLDSGYYGDFGSYGSGEGQFVWADRHRVR